MSNGRIRGNVFPLNIAKVVQMIHKTYIWAAIVLISVVLNGCTGQTSAPGPAIPPEQKSTEQPAQKTVEEPVNKVVVIDRESKIPPDQVKMTPEIDLLPPVLHSDEYEEPVPMPYPVNTAGAEDSGFMMPDGATFYIWFTPDPDAPLGDQLDDGVTGIYVFRKSGEEWQGPERITLQDPDKQSLDGCEFIQNDIMWFCTARTGYTGLHWFKAYYREGQWKDWENADFDPEYEVGELHFTADGKELYFHSARPGGKGQYDIWVSKNEGGKWLPPQNIEIVNSPEMDGWPSLTGDGNELWITRFYMGSPALFRSRRINGEWQEPELMVSQFAAESSIDREGNIYFTHHFYKDGVMLEADIYMAYKKR
jgi:hypothetical protein